MTNTRTFAENIAHTTIFAMKIQTEYKALALAAAQADYMLPGQDEELVLASQKSHAASHLLTIIDGHGTDMETFFNYLDDALHFFVNKPNASSASISVISHTLNLFLTRTI